MLVTGTILNGKQEKLISSLVEKATEQIESRIPLSNKQIKSEL